jgi:hypothetical protein
MHCLLISFGSAETQRGDEAVSGSRTPTLLLLGVPPPDDPLELLLPQAASPASSVSATPVIATAVRIRMCIGGALSIASAGRPSLGARQALHADELEDSRAHGER